MVWILSNKKYDRSFDMPIIIPKDLPAYDILEKESVFIMNEARATSQDIRPLKIALLNLMPKKIVTETQILRMLANSPLQIDVDLVTLESHESKNTKKEHLLKFYKTFSQIKNNKYDGMIITGAPVEHIDFEEVDYWDELTEVFEFCKTNVHSTMFICWAFQAGLYYYYKIPKYTLSEKLFGVFEHQIIKRKTIVRGFDDEFFIPHSRHTTTKIEDIEKIDELDIIAASKDAGVYMCMCEEKRFIFVSGHAEYDRYTLDEEYKRDLALNKDIKIPQNYYPNDDISKKPYMNWKAHSNLLFSNWLNYHLYQTTPYDIDKI